MGALQSKVYSEVTTTGSPSENQTASSKVTVIANEPEKENVRPSTQQTPTGPSLAGRFKAASIDPRSPGGQEVTRTPILLKTQNGEEGDLSKELDQDSTGKKKKFIPSRGMAAFIDKLDQQMDDGTTTNTSNEVENVTNLTSKMEIGSTPGANGNSPTDIECRSPLLVENTDPAIKMSLRPGGGIITPNNARCGKKTMFPMTFGYQEAKSPRSPLGTVNMNSDFLASPAFASKGKAAGDFKEDCDEAVKDTMQTSQQKEPKNLFNEEMGDLLKNH